VHRPAPIIVAIAVLAIRLVGHIAAHSVTTFFASSIQMPKFSSVLDEVVVLEVVVLARLIASRALSRQMASIAKVMYGQ
jgi:hypothetical protein